MAPMTIMVIWSKVMTWAATQAKAKFSEVLDRAETEGPQIVRRRKREYCVMTREAYEALPHDADDSKSSANRVAKKHENLAEFFRNSPLADLDTPLERVHLEPRHFDF